MCSEETTTSNKVSTKKQQVSSTSEQQLISIEKEPIEKQVEDTSLGIEDAFKLTLDLKVNMMNKNSFVQYKSRIGFFQK